MNKLKLAVLICLLLIVISFSFFPSLQNGFVSWDDNVLVTENTLIRDLSWKKGAKIFTSFHHGLYHPLVLLSYAVEYKFFKLNPAVYHTTNLILHLFNSLLVFWLVFLLSGSFYGSFLVALFFGIHPIHVESVAWVSERKDVLYALFFLGALIAYIYYQRKNDIRYYYICLFVFILSVLSKAMAVTFPIVMLLYDYLVTSNSNRLNSKRAPVGITIVKKGFLLKIPFFIIAFVFGIIALFAKYYTGAITEEPVPCVNNLLVTSHRLVFYLLRTFSPISNLYLYPYCPKTGYLLPSIFWLASILVVILVFSTIILSKYSKKFTFGILFFLVTILPVIPLMNVGYSADRYAYIPVIGLFYIMLEFSRRFYNKFLRRFGWFKVILTILILMAIAKLSFLTRQKCGVWKNDLTLWSDAIKDHPHLAMFYVKRANVYFGKKDYGSAFLDYNKAIKIEPNYADAYYNRGILYSSMEEFDNAISDYSRVILLNSNYAAAYINRGVIYYKKREFDKSLSDYNQALKINPNYSEAYFYKGNTYFGMGEYDKSILDYTQAIRLKPNYTEGYYNRALSYFMNNNYPLSWQDIQKCINSGYEVNPEFLKSLKKSLEG
ncbi:MAG: tetratricopeptide repeat protein [Candidatus Omnitrophica bacterium]|nr:tetratricopeptide repeat protein [Candidatus Omnitrophota bacterium]